MMSNTKEREYLERLCRASEKIEDLKAALSAKEEEVRQLKEMMVQYQGDKSSLGKEVERLRSGLVNIDAIAEDAHAQYVQDIKYTGGVCDGLRLLKKIREEAKQILGE